MENIELIKDRILKIKNLAESGCQGEAIAAQRALERLLEKYDLSLDDICDDRPEWRWIKTGRSKDVKEILFQCFFQITDKSDCKYRELKQYGEIGFELTSAQYADLMSLFEFHSKQFKIERDKLLKNLCKAYIHKHEIWHKTDTPDNDEETQRKRKPIDVDELRYILFLVNSFEDVTYHKQLNQQT
jgi:hypothetical protein